MFRFFLQISLTTSALHDAMQHPRDPLAAVRAPIESLGGTLREAFFTADAYDVLAITEFPHNVSPADLSIAFFSGDAVANLYTYPILTSAQARDAKRVSASHLRPRPLAASAT